MGGTIYKLFKIYKFYLGILHKPAPSHRDSMNVFVK